MKKEIHPKAREVIFVDKSSDERFLILSTVETSKVDKWKDGKEYPKYEIEISSASHPFYTGKKTVVDTAGRVQKFKVRKDKAQKGKIINKKTKKEVKRVKRVKSRKSVEPKKPKDITKK